MKIGLSVWCVLVPGVMLVTAVYASEMRIEGGALQLNGGTVQNCSIIRGTGTANSVYTIAGGKWMSVWTNNNSAADFVTFSTSLNN